MEVETNGVEIVITSSSRPELFKQFWESFENMVITRDELRITIHEDFLIPKKSMKVKKYVLSQATFINNKDHFFISTNPAEGVGYAMDYLLNYHIRSKYVLFFEDDWVIEKPIYVDMITKLMNDFPDMQQVIFPKKRVDTMRKVNESYFFQDYDLSLTEFDGWSYNPNIFRTSFVREYWSNACAKKKYPEAEFGRSLPKDFLSRKSFFLGKRDDERHVRHIGEKEKSTKRMKT